MALARQSSAPRDFLLSALLAFVGGALYAPNNYDALTYRFPRVLHWFSEHGWHWIETEEGRMNISATGFEWLMAPFFALTHSDRGVFLINIFSFLLLPGLIYATLVRLGIGKRMAWYWMWLFPTGCCFILQAGSVGNDASAAVYLLAAIAFTLRARESGRVSDLWFGMLAAALLTGAKASNLPLMLPWTLALLPSLRLLRSKLAGTLAVGVVCVGISFLPLAIMNAKHTGDWAGDPHNESGMKLDHPGYGIAGNALQLLVHSAMPPVMPVAAAWNKHILEFQKQHLQPLVKHFPRLLLTWNELDQEEGAGLGLALSTLLVATGIAAVRRPSGRLFREHAANKTGLLICTGGWIALLAYMAKMGSEVPSRLVIPYYALIAASVLLLPGSYCLPRQRWWRVSAQIVALLSLPLLIINPSRPLWPVQTVFSKLAAAYPGNRSIKRAQTVYAVYRDRSDALAPLRRHLSEKDALVGFLGNNQPEASLWKPFGARVIRDVTRENQEAFTKNEGLLITTSYAITCTFHQPAETWVAQHHGRIVGSEDLQTMASGGTRNWLVIRFNPNVGKEQQLLLK